MGFRVRNINTGTIETGIPTPRLIEAGGGEAFEKDGVWYIHEPGTQHVSPTGEYARVRVEQTQPYKVTVDITASDGKDSETYSDWFVVEAATRTEAEDLASAAAHEDVEQRYGEEFSSDIRIIKVAPGVSI